MRYISNLILIAATAAFLFSCDKDSAQPDSQWKNSVFIINEGPFQNGSGTVMAFDRDSGTVTSDLFEQANGRPLGNIVQSIAVYRDLAWIAVNNSNRVEVVNMQDFKSVASIDQVNSPRYIVFYEETAYVSSWDNIIAKIDVNTFSKTGDIPTGAGPDEMLIASGRLFVMNTGAWGSDNRISVVDPGNDEVVTLTLADRPAGIVADKSGRVWVLCSGLGYNGFPNPDTDTQGALYCIDPVSLEILHSLQFPAADLHPEQLIANETGDVLYYFHPGGIFSVSVDNPSLSNMPLIPSDIYFYGLGFDEKTGLIYAADPLDYVQNGMIYRFDPADGALLDSFRAGIIPNGFWFN